MEFLSRLGRWWSDQWRTTNKIGKLAMLVVPLFLGCCGMTMLSALVSPDAEPTAEPAVAGERVATVAIAEDPPTAEPPTSAPTDEPTPVPATATPRPSATPEPTAQPTAEPPPTNAPLRAATSVAATVAASQPTAAPTVAAPTAVPPTSAPTLVPTAIPPTAAPPTTAPTAEVFPTATLPTAAGALVIIGVDKRAEVVTIRNDGGAEVNLVGWVLRSEKGSQDCGLGGVLGPGQVLQIWAMAEDAGQGGYNCGFGSDIWNNSEPDTALLIDPSGAVVSRW